MTTQMGLEAGLQATSSGTIADAWCGSYHRLLILCACPLDVLLECGAVEAPAPGLLQKGLIWWKLQQDQTCCAITSCDWMR